MAVPFYDRQLRGMGGGHRGLPAGTGTGRNPDRFDQMGPFIAHGYTNPFREAGCPDWYFFWTRIHTMGSLKRWARDAGLIPAKDLPLGRGGYGIDTGLRSATLPAFAP